MTRKTHLDQGGLGRGRGGRRLELRVEEVAEVAVVQDDVVVAPGDLGQLLEDPHLGGQRDHAAADVHGLGPPDGGLDVAGVAGGQAAHDHEKLRDEERMRCLGFT